MNRRAVFATHHKTGSVWMASVFRAIARSLDIPMVSLTGDQNVAASPPPAIIQDSHSTWYRDHAAHHQPDDRVFHLIRDPRDVVISAMNYHRQAAEKWLHVPRDKFGGKTYQERIDSLPDDHARYLFEMDNSAGNVTRAFARWNYRRAECFEAKYEDLMADTDGVLFVQAATHLGFEGDALNICREQFWAHSLFGGKSERAPKMKHVRAGQGRQWEQVFDRSLAEAFVQRFGDVLIRLGYEKDHAWVEAR